MNVRYPLVSVITPTWRRHDALLTRCIPSVYAQTHPLVEHVIVSDGPDRELDAILAADLWRRPRQSRPLVYEQLPVHAEYPNGEVDYGSCARNWGNVVATGRYVCYLDDDNAFRPDHVATLLAALEENPDVDFAYSQLQVHPTGLVIGYPPPAYTQIDTSLIMHRAGVTARLGEWRSPPDMDVNDHHAPDWDVVQRWLRNGARWVHVPRVTLDYWRPA